MATTRLGGRTSQVALASPTARRTLAGRHRALAVLVEAAHPIPRTLPDPRPLTHLAVRTVVAQLVSTAAAETITTRLLDTHGSYEAIVAWAMAEPADAPPSGGLSRAKRQALAAWGRMVEAEGDPRPRWEGLDAEALQREITRLRGFGRWSAEMLAIFGFGHPNIWPEGDAGVQRVMRTLIPRMKPAGHRRLVAGYETLATLCCWSVLDRGRLEQCRARL